MAAPESGTCGPWIDVEDVAACCRGLADPPDETQLEKAIVFATNVLYRWSGRQYPGECERTVRPCSGDQCGCGAMSTLYDSGWAWFWWDTVESAWSWMPWASDSLFPLCGCTQGCDPPMVVLPAPVADVTQVVIDGEVLDPSAYGVTRFRELRRLDGLAWPMTNDLTLDSAPGGDPGTWQITYTYGRGPGPDGEIACAQFACQVAKYLCNSDDPSCMLNDRVRSIVREGVSFSLEDLERLLDEGRTGVRITDLWLDSVNPNRNQRRARATRLGAPRTNYREFT